MTQDEIIEMARQVGVNATGNEYWPFFIEELEAFAKLVADKVNADWSETNERLIKVFNEKADLAYLSGAKEEREACAKICDSFQERDVGMQPAECAGAIRARNKHEN